MIEFLRRPGTDADAEFIFECITTALGPHVVATYGAWDEDWQREHFARTTDPRKHEVLEVSGAPIGCLLIEECDAYVELHRILVVPKFQNRGIGTCVVREVLRAARSTGRPTRLQVFRISPARRLYERLGFSVVSESKTHFIMEAGG